MQQSEYQTQAYINDGLNQQQALDSLEGSAALLRPNKPQVDGTDIQKQQILAKTDHKKAVTQSLTPGNQLKTVSRHRNPIQTTKTPNYRKS
jgi:hypothetical protein